MKLLKVLVLSLWQCLAFSQKNEILSGTIMNSNTNEPISYATIKLLDKNDSLVRGEVSNIDGYFQISILNDNIYSIEISSVGYQNLVINYDSTSKNLGIILLHESRINLDEVIVKGVNLPKSKFDRVEYIVSAKDLNTPFEDILRRLPLIQFDKNDVITINGSSDYLILLNGKRTNLPLSIIKNRLGGSIKSIEIIHTPSSKYDSKVVLNINTVKNIIGVANTNFISLGNRTSNIGSSIDCEKEKALMGGQFNYTFDKVRDGSAANLNSIDQVEQNNILTPSLNTRLYYEYDIDSLNFIGLSFSYNLDKNNVNNLTNSIRTNQFEKVSTGGILTLDYIRQLKGDNHLINIYSIISKDSDTTSIQNSSILGGFNNGSILGFTNNIDYSFNINKILNLEAGFKHTNRHHKTYFSGITNDITEYDFKQVTTSFYLSNTCEINDISKIRLGLRLTSYNYVWSKEIIRTAYFLPNILYAISPNDRSQISFNINSRINIPGIDYLSPFQNNFNNFNTITGNPNLIPELTHAYELKYFSFNPKLQFSSIVYFSTTNNVILSKRSVLSEFDNNTNMTFDNFGKAYQIGWKANISKNYTNGNSFSANMDIYNYNLPISNIKINNILSRFGVQGHMNIRKLYSFDYYGNIFPKTILPQGYRSGEYFYNFSFKRKIRSGGVSMDLYNIFNDKIQSSYFLLGENFSYKSINFYYSRWIKMRLYFTIGNTNKNEKSNSTNDSDEIKSKDKALFNTNH